MKVAILIMLSKIRSNRLRTNKNEKPEKMYTTVILYVRGVSKKLRRIGSDCKYEPNLEVASNKN